MKHILIFFIIITFAISTNSQSIHGEFVGCLDTLYIKINNEVILNSFSEKCGIMVDSLIIFDTDTLILKRFKNSNIFFLPPKNNNICGGRYDAFFLTKEYWLNGNIKYDISIKYSLKKGMIQHGKTIFYNEDGTIKEIHKYKNGKRL